MVRAMMSAPSLRDPGLGRGQTQFPSMERVGVAYPAGGVASCRAYTAEQIGTI